MEGNNPNFYGYVYNSNEQADIFGLDLCPKGKRGSEIDFGGEKVRGFKNGGEIMERLGNLKNRLKALGYGDVKVGVRGSSVEGVSSKGAGEFFSNPKADIDFFAVDESITSKLPIDAKGTVKPKYLDPKIQNVLDDFGAQSTHQLGRPSSVRYIDPSALNNGKYIIY